MKKYLSCIGISVVVVLGAVLRFMPALYKRDYWYDEAFTGILLKQSWHQMNQLIFADVHPPLYYWLAKLFAAPFDYSPAGIRIFSAIFGIATIISLYWIGKKMWGQWGGFLSAILAAVSPFAIQYSQEARMYALFGFLMLWSVWFFYQALENNKWRDWIWWGVFSGLAFYTHYLALFFFVMFYVGYCVSQVQSAKCKVQSCNLKSKVIEIFKALFPSRGFWTGVLIIGLFFGSWLKIFLYHLSHTGGDLGWIAPSNLSDISKTLQIFFFGHPAGIGGTPDANSFRFFFDSSSVGLMVLIFMIMLFALAWIRDIKRKEFSLLAILSIGTLIFLIVLSHFGIKFYVARYMMPAAVIVYLLLGGLMSQVLRNNIAKSLVMVVYLGLLFMLNPLSYNHGWYDFMHQYADQLYEGKMLVATNPFDYTSARYYFGKENVRLYNRNNPSESFAGWVVVGDENRLTEWDQIQDLKNFLVIDNTCDWEQVKLNEIGQAGQYKVCEDGE